VTLIMMYHTAVKRPENEHRGPKGGRCWNNIRDLRWGKSISKLSRHRLSWIM